MHVSAEGDGGREDGQACCPEHSSLVGGVFHDVGESGGYMRITCVRIVIAILFMVIAWSAKRKPAVVGFLMDGEMLWDKRKAAGAKASD